MNSTERDSLFFRIKSCTICQAFLPLGPRPVFIADPEAKILIVGQAPGTKVHASGIPWDDLSGKELRRWLGVEAGDFYNPKLFAIVPMGFCYPGRGKGGDLPPRPECAPHWHQQLLDQMPNIRLTLLIGKYSQDYYLGKSKKKNLTETVASFEEYLPEYFPLVHPSPRNKRWQMRNPWFEHNIVPVLREKVKSILQPSY
jgi:uracil-DNA glycosylase